MYLNSGLMLLHRETDVDSRFTSTVAETSNARRLGQQDIPSARRGRTYTRWSKCGVVVERVRGVESP